MMNGNPQLCKLAPFQIALKHIGYSLTNWQRIRVDFKDDLALNTK
jgi:hypothetical protein